jgi:predicted TIM-barrel fold metal-dependent hydrolase
LTNFSTSLSKQSGAKSLSLFLPLASIVFFAYLLSSQVRLQVAQSAAPAVVPAASPFVDVHTHIDDQDPDGSAQAAFQALGRENAARIFLLTEPFPPKNPKRYEADVILPAAKKFPGKLPVLGGGSILNGMIMGSVGTGDAGAEVKRKFRKAAEDLLRDGVVGFGEVTAEHLGLPSSPIQEHEYAPPNHPLFLLLADIAAEHNVPIDLHMEAVPQSMPLPSGLPPSNPPQLQANIADFEKLLAHNSRAKIIWAHAGADFTGFRTPDLCRRLLQAHPNLYMEIKADPLSPGKNPIAAADGKVKPEWFKLFQDFPDRFVIGTDQHYGPKSSTGQPRWQAVVLIFNQLPPDLRRKIGLENAAHLFADAPVVTSSARR